LKKEFVKSQPKIVQDFAVFVMEKLKDKVLNKAKDNTKGSIKSFKIKTNSVKDVKMIADIY